MSSRRAVVVVELLFVCALLGVLAGAVAYRLRDHGIALAALEVSRVVGTARLEAVLRGTSICLERPHHAAVWPPRGLLFTPDGLPRTCDGGGLGNTTILLEHRGREAAVIVSALGRVRWELR